jgi:CubicO group peptidase (beta-lactamase class C family)
MKRILAAFLCMSLAAAGPQPVDHAMQQRIAAIAQHALAKQNVPGISIAIAEQGHMVYARGFGWSNVDDRVPVDAATTFRIGSITKQFTAASIMLLAQAGKLRVDDKLSKYLPNAPHAGGLNTSASDLARWDIALDAGKVVTPQSFAMMSTAQKLADGKSAGYGFGLGVGTYLHRKVVAHTGGVPGFITENYTFPKDNVAIVVFGNSDSFQPGPVVHQIASALYGEKFTPPPVKAVPESAAQAARAKLYLMQALAGKFSSMRMREDTARYLHGVLAAQYVDLGRRLGKLRSLELVGSDPRPPVLSYFYRAVFERGTMSYSLALDPNGTVVGIGLQQWPS